MPIDLKKEPIGIMGNIKISEQILGFDFDKGSFHPLKGMSITACAKNPKIRILVRLGYLSVVVYGETLDREEGARWLDSVTRGELQF